MLRRFAVLVVLLLAHPAGMPAQNPQAAADLVLLDGKVLTVDVQFSEARAFAVRDGRFIKVGSTPEIRPYIGPSTRVIEGRGRASSTRTCTL
jgi:hypothetical protein